MFPLFPGPHKIQLYYERRLRQMERLGRHGAPRRRRLFGIQRGAGGARGRPPQGADREVQPAAEGVRG